MCKALCALPDDHNSGGTQGDDDDNKNEAGLPFPWDVVMNPPAWNPEEWRRNIPSWSPESHGGGDKDDNGDPDEDNGDGGGEGDDNDMIMKVKVVRQKR